MGQQRQRPTWRIGAPHSCQWSRKVAHRWQFRCTHSRTHRPHLSARQTRVLVSSLSIAREVDAGQRPSARISCSSPVHRRREPGGQPCPAQDTLQGGSGELNFRQVASMEIYGNKQTFNFEAVLHKNIVDSDYYRSISTYETWSEVIDEIYETVESVEPWLTGNARGPSTAFCCLYKLCNMQLTRKNISDTLSHPDSPFIRAVGFLYLRYVCDPKQIWSWVQPYIDDPEEFKPSPYGDAVTMGAYLRDLLLSQYYFETIFPRIPVVVERSVKEDLKRRGLPMTAVGNGGTGGPDRRGTDESNKRPPSVKAALSVAFGQTAPNRRGTREKFRVGDRDEGKPSRGGGKRDSQDRGRSTSVDPAGRERDSRKDDRDRRDYDRDRDRREYDRRDRRDYDRRDRERGRRRSRSRSRSRDRGRDYGSDRRHYRDRDHRDSHRSGRDYRDRDREDRDRRGRDRDGGDRGGGRDSRDVFRESSDVFRDGASGKGGADIDDLKKRYL